MKRIIISLIATLGFLISCGEQPKDNATPKSEKKEVVEASESTTSSNKPSGPVRYETENKLGKRVFLLCTACHSLKKGEDHKTGPSLYGIMGAKAAMKDGFVYSDALKASGIVWDEAQLRKWIIDPATHVPGTSMAFIGIKDEKKQTALIEFLKEQTK